MKLMPFAQVVAPIERPTYHYVTAEITPVATATDVLTLSGSPSKRAVRIHRVSVQGAATADAAYRVNFIKRTAANTGGTSSNPTPAKADSNDQAATATLALYTANPTGLGSGVAMDSKLVWLPAAATPAAAPAIVTFDGPLVLHGATELLAVNFGGAAVPSGTLLTICVEWSEDGE